MSEIGQRNQGLAKRASVGAIGPQRTVKVPVWARAREYTVEALHVMVTAMRDQTLPTDRRAVWADKILDRGWGRAPMLIAHQDERPVRLTLDALNSDQLAQLERLLLAVAKPTLPNANESQVIEGECAAVGEPEGDR